MLGLSLSTFTTLHVILCFVAIGSGVIVIAGLLRSKRLEGWIAVYLVSALAASASGFGFPFEKILPSHILGVISLVVLILATVARYLFHLAGAWRWVFSVGVVLGVYFQIFVAIAQLFQKVPSFQMLAPTQSEPPFAIAQGIALGVFVALAIPGAIKFRPLAVQP
jgi:hypothetical protein